MSKCCNAAYAIMRTIGREARRDPKRIVFPHAANARLLRAVQQIVDEGIAKPILLGRAAEIARLCDELSLDLLSQRCRDHRPARPRPTRRYTDRLYAAAPAQGPDLVRGAGAAPEERLLRRDDGRPRRRRRHGHRPAAQLPGDRAAAARDLRDAAGREGRGRHVHDGDAERGASSSATPCSTSTPTPRRSPTSRSRWPTPSTGFGVEPRVAMISYSNFGSVAAPRGHEGPAGARARAARRRPDLEIDGEMQPEIALDAERRATVLRVLAAHQEREHARVRLARAPATRRTRR